jgi:hypothetical protein
MYWALALGEEPAGAHVLRMSVNPKTGKCRPELTMTIYPLEFQRRADEKWTRAQVPRASDARRRLLGLFGRVGRKGLAPDRKSLADFGCGTRPDFCTDRGDVARIVG